jgi:seryl-tRNA synthetase
MMRHMNPNGDRSTTGHATSQKSEQRYSIPEAAKLLGLTEEAVRQRVKRGTLDSTKVDGSLFVLLDAERYADRSSDRSKPVDDTLGDRSGDTSRLVDTLEAEVAHLRRQLEQANERDSENRRIIAMLTSRIPELPAPESPPEPSESPRTATESPGSSTGPQDQTEPQTERRRSWWERLFGG